MVNRYTHNLSRLWKEGFSPRFILSRVLLRLGVNLAFPITFSKKYNVKTYLHSSSAAQKLLAGKYKPELDVAVFEHFIQSNNCVFDIGANIGMFSVLAARLVGENGRVYAFEPTYKTFGCLLENITLNKVNNVFPVLGAVSNGNGSVFLHDHEYSKEQNYIDINSADGLRVQTYRLDTYLKNITEQKINFLKIDVEGAELLVLRSLGDRLKDIETVYVEYVSENYSAFGYTKEDIVQFLSDAEFGLYYVSLSGDELKLVPFNESDKGGYGRNIIATRRANVIN